MDLFNRKKVKALEAKVSTLVNHRKSFAPGGGGFESFDINDFKRFLSDGRFLVGSRLAYDLYDRASPLSNSVDKIAGAIANLKPMVRTIDGELVKDSKVIKVLDNVGFGQSYPQFIQDYGISFLLTRDAYLITDPFRRTLRTPKPFDVEIEANNNDGYVDNYRVTAMNSGKQATFNREVVGNTWIFKDDFDQELFHLKGQTSDDGLSGRSPIESILVEISQNVEGSKWNLSLLQNGMRPSGMFSTDTELSDDQFERLKEQMDQEQSGSGNAGNNIVADGGLKFVEMSTTNRDMDYINILKSSKIEVASKYNIPIPLISPDNMTLANYAIAEQAFYDNAVFPIAELLFTSIGKALDIEEGQVLTFDKDEIAAIRERRINEAAARHKIGVFSDNETREGLGFEGYPEGDTVYKPSAMLPVGQEDGARDGGEIEQDEEKKAFLKSCHEMGLSKEESLLQWISIERS